LRNEGLAQTRAFDGPRAGRNHATSVGATPVPVVVTTAGQNAAVTVAGAAGQAVTVRLTGNTIGSLTLQLVAPNGGVLKTAYPSQPTATFVHTLPVAGVSTIRLDPMHARTGSASVQVTTP
jgi:hypothetical protein